MIIGCRGPQLELVGEHWRRCGCRCVIHGSSQRPLVQHRLRPFCMHIADRVTGPSLVSRNLHEGERALVVSCGPCAQRSCCGAQNFVDSLVIIFRRVKSAADRGVGGIGRQRRLSMIRPVVARLVRGCELTASDAWCNFGRCAGVHALLVAAVAAVAGGGESKQRRQRLRRRRTCGAPHRFPATRPAGRAAGAGCAQPACASLSLASIRRQVGSACA